MKLFLLTANENAQAFIPWYDKAFGHVVRAENEEIARRLASENSGDEGMAAWLSPDMTNITELSLAGDNEHIIVDFRGA